MVVAANPADPTGDEVSVARILVLHEHAIPSEDRRRAVAFGNLTVLEVDFRKDAEAAHYPRDGIPVHFNEAFRLRKDGFLCADHRRHAGLLSPCRSGSYPVVSLVPR